VPRIQAQCLLLGLALLGLALLCLALLCLALLGLALLGMALLLWMALLCLALLCLSLFLVVSWRGAFDPCATAVFLFVWTGRSGSYRLEIASIPSRSIQKTIG
jgi:hypothetical protein